LYTAFQLPKEKQHISVYNSVKPFRSQTAMDWDSVPSNFSGSVNDVSQPSAAGRLMAYPHYN